MELYAALGDRFTQNRIREEYPGRHCAVLLADPDSCLRCQLGPFEGIDGSCRKAWTDYGMLIPEARQLDCAVSIGHFPVGELSSQQFELIMRYREAKEALTASFLVEGISNSIAKLMMGGKSDA